MKGERDGLCLNRRGNVRSVQTSHVIVGMLYLQRKYELPSNWMSLSKDCNQTRLIPRLQTMFDTSASYSRDPGLNNCSEIFRKLFAYLQLTSGIIYITPKLKVKTKLFQCSINTKP